MSDLKQLRLEREKIQPAIIGFAAGRPVSGPTDKGNNRVEYEIDVADDQPVALLHVLFRDDGTTTLSYKVGKNPQKSEEIARLVASVATAAKALEQKPLSLKSLPLDVWEILLELLKEESFDVSEETMLHGVRFRVKAGRGDEVLLHRYNTGSFLMQGKAWLAYGKVVSILSELAVDKKPLIDAQLETYEIKSVSSEGLLAELEECIPSACSILGDGVKCMLAPALAFSKLKIELPDYSALTHPALRGLEACIKQLFFTFGGYEIKSREGFGPYFDGPRLKSSVKMKVDCAKTTGAIEKLYELYNKHRPGLFHSDGIPEMSRRVESRQEAVGLIHEVLHAIELNFKGIPAKS